MLIRPEDENSLFSADPRLREEPPVEVSLDDEGFEEKVRREENRELNSRGREDVDCPDSDRRLWVERWLRVLVDENDRPWKGTLPARLEVNSLIRREEIVARLLPVPVVLKVDRRREVATPRPLDARPEEDERQMLRSASEPLNRPPLPNARPE